MKKHYVIDSITEFEGKTFSVPVLFYGTFDEAMETARKSLEREETKIVNVSNVAIISQFKIEKDEQIN